MSATATKTDYSPENLLELPDAVGFELVDGQLVERPLSGLSSYIGGQLFKRIDNYCESAQLGWVFPADAGYQCFPDDPGRVRKPDASFVRRERLPEGPPAHGFLRVPPDMAAEVLSPNELAYDLDRKVQEYLDAGVQLVWIVNPETRTARVHRADGSITGLREPDELTGEEIIPGFRCRIADLFREIAETSVESGRSSERENQ